jgi:hypothetical protein
MRSSKQRPQSQEVWQRRLCHPWLLLRQQQGNGTWQLQLCQALWQAWVPMHRMCLQGKCPVPVLLQLSWQVHAMRLPLRQPCWGICSRRGPCFPHRAGR